MHAGDVIQGVSSSSYSSFIAQALVVLHLVCLPVDISTFLPSLCFPHLPCLFLSLKFITSCTLSFHHHHVSISPGDLRPAVMLNTSCPTLNIVVLLSSHHSCTLSTGLTFSNTVSLNFILRFSSFNLQHFIPGIACSGVQRVLPSLLLLMCQFRSPPTITLSPSCVALSS